MIVCRCGAEVVQVGRGRPRKWCDQCRPRSRPLVPEPWRPPAPLPGRVPAGRVCVRCSLVVLFKPAAGPTPSVCVGCARLRDLARQARQRAQRAAAATGPAPASPPAAATRPVSAVTAVDELRLAVAALSEQVRPSVVWWLHAQAEVLTPGPTERLLRAVARLVDERELAEVALIAAVELELARPAPPPSSGAVAPPGDRPAGTVVYDQDLNPVEFRPDVTGDR